MQTPKKVSNTRAITANWLITGYCPKYSPSPNSARNVAASWQALVKVAKPGKPVTVEQYLKAQAELNPGNIGDALPCFRYWASNGKLALAPPKA
jgi:hypothetical protein